MAEPAAGPKAEPGGGGGAAEATGPAGRLRVVIVGGGTAGWMTAAGLARLLPHAASVHLVESATIPIIGVGEATLPHLRFFNERLGIDEADFMARTRATFKLGIEFRDWARIGDSYIHPFGTFGSGRGEVDFHHFYARALAEGIDLPPVEAFSYGGTLARADRFAVPDPDPRAIASTYGYAYQFDALLFAPYLRTLAEGAGATRSEGLVAGVERCGETGDILALDLADGRRIAGDLFVDCSGFRAALIGGELGEPYEDWSHWLPTDSAVAMPCATRTALTPYTTATAMPAGWRWRIPLQHRTGNGYVFASAFTTAEAATDALVAAVEGEPLAPPRLLRFTAGRRRRGWVHNCVAVGLAGGFLEPLESTSLYLVQAAITQLVELFPHTGAAAVERDEFNRLTDLEYDRIRDFLILHYHATTRDDAPFWDYVRTMSVPDSLADKLALWTERGRVAKYREGVFHEASWIAVYCGQRVLPAGWDPRADAATAPALGRALDGLRAEIAADVARRPGHLDYIARYCPMAAGGAQGAA